MSRIFITLAIVSWLLLGFSFERGWQIDDPTIPTATAQSTVSRHFLISLAALVFATLVHALVLTYFMGTGRWMEETSQAYTLDPKWRQRNQSLKYRTIPLLVLAVLLLITLGASGGASDPASPLHTGWPRWIPVEAARGHLILACVALAFNALVNALEFRAIRLNGKLIEEVIAHVRQMRQERGLPV